MRTFTTDMVVATAKVTAVVIKAHPEKLAAVLGATSLQSLAEALGVFKEAERLNEGVGDTLLRVLNENKGGSVKS